tara:strand:+ start:26029 stop:26559 length:531 start_codon:yes stop_codon:yes gene_type:complete
MQTYHFTDFPDIKTERLLLRQITLEDTHAIFKIRTNEKINSQIKRPLFQNKEEASTFIKKLRERFENRQLIFWGITLETQLIGSIVYHNIKEDLHYAEIGYELLPNFHQRGYMGEAMKTVIAFGIDKLNLKTIEAFTHKNNNASQTLLRKHGFKIEADRRDENFEDNRIFKLSINS